MTQDTRIHPLDRPTPAEMLRAGTYTARGHRAWKPSKVRMRAMRAYVLDRDEHTCGWCGYSDASGLNLELDHIIPYKLGGFFVTSNLWVLCQSCNVSKGADL